jgi:hypothetical protein
MQITEIFFYFSVVVCFLILTFLLFSLWKSKPNSSSKSNKNTSSPTQKNEAEVLEVFDYLGTKIIHENGTYTVNQKGKITTYKSWAELPVQFQKMVKELDNRSLQKKSGDYFLETINGIYYLTFPDGKRKKYKSLSEIPAHIRKAIGK